MKFVDDDDVIKRL